MKENPVTDIVAVIEGDMMFGKKKAKVTTVNKDVTKTLHRHLAFFGAEQYKLLRTNISFTLPEGVKCPIIGVTSSMRGEGKSTTAINLSYALAENGKRVVLIDGDLRLPSVAAKMKMSNSPGLTDLLVGGEGQEINMYKMRDAENWCIIPSGELPPNPSELLGSKRMEKLLKTLADKFDYIVVDLPPVNSVSDALALSKHITGMVLVVRQNYTSKNELAACVRQLKLSNVNVLGCVMNGKKSSKSGYGYKKYYKKYKKYGYGYGYGYENAKKPAKADAKQADNPSKDSAD